MPSIARFLAALALSAALTQASAARAEQAPAAPKPHRVIENHVVDTLATVEVTDTFERHLRHIQSASQGSVSAAELKLRPVYRAGEMLETVPGVVISQHSGEGKANQYYLRGFNLDHGTDFATFVAGVPVNMPTHAHGQGYSDLNFVIPELVSGVEYKKGTAYADEGDFGTAGAAHLAYRNTLDAPVARFSVDGDGYRRALAAGSRSGPHGDLLGAVEVYHNDGPWVRPDDYRKLNALVRYGHNGAHTGYRVTAMGYNGRWNSTDQIAERAVRSGLIDRFGALDPTDGGRSGRYSLSADWQRFDAHALTQVTAYAMAYQLDLFSNFTYFLDDTVHGDQFHQADRRVVTGLRAQQTWRGQWGPREVEGSGGLQFRRDDIGRVGLYHTQARQILSTTREDRVAQMSVSPWTSMAVQWLPYLRTTVGLRSDTYLFRVTSLDAANSGDATSSLLSPKLALLVGPWGRTAFFANAGDGFHSNDARGTTITRDPSTLEAVQKVNPLVRAKGGEVGVRTGAIPGVVASVALWRLDVESELVFTGDAGTTQASRPSARSGIEINATARGRALQADASAAFSRARFTDRDAAGDRIPGAVESVISAGLAVPDFHRLFAAARVRAFGPRPLIEDDSIRSRASTVLSAELGMHLPHGLSVALEGFNLLDARVSDIDYWYTSRLRGEPAGGVDDIHTHPEEPRTLRIRLASGG